MAEEQDNPWAYPWYGRYALALAMGAGCVLTIVKYGAGWNLPLALAAVFGLFALSLAWELGLLLLVLVVGYVAWYYMHDASRTTWLVVVALLLYWSMEYQLSQIYAEVKAIRALLEVFTRRDY